MSTASVQLIILLGAMLASGAIGFWIGREKYLGGSVKYGGHKPLPNNPPAKARMAPTVQ